MQGNLSILSALADSACRPVKGRVWLTGSVRGARLPVTARLISTWQSGVEEMRAWRIGHANVLKFERKLLPKHNILGDLAYQCCNSVSVSPLWICFPERVNGFVYIFK